MRLLMRGLRQTLTPIIFLLVGCFLMPVAISYAQEQTGPAQDLELLDAVRMAIGLNPAVLLQTEQTKFYRGAYDAAGGPFDTLLKGDIARDDQRLSLTKSNQALAGGETESVTRTTSYTLGLQQQLRTGTVLSLGGGMTRSDENLLQVFPENRSSVSFQVVQPLFRGRGSSAADVTGEKAAGKQYEASLQDLYFTINRNVLDTAEAYWDYVAASKNLEILRESEAKAARLIEEIKELIAADERPRSDLGQVEANLADKSAARISAEQALFQARQVLGLKMGASSEQIAALGYPKTTFPVSDEAASAAINSDGLQKLACSRRPDLKADAIREEGVAFLVAGAENDLLPRVDLQLAMGYSGLTEGRSTRNFFTPFTDNTAGPNVTARLSMALPLRNSGARGTLIQQKAVLEQQKITRNERKRQISSDVSVAVSALLTSMKGVEKSERAVKFYRDAIEDEKAKLKLGLSTLIDLISLEDRLTNALVVNVAQHIRYSKAVIELRFETGTLIECSDKGCLIGPEQLSRLPDGRS